MNKVREIIKLFQKIDYYCSQSSGVLLKKTSSTKGSSKMKYLKRSLIVWILSITIILLPALSFPQNKSKASKQKLYTAYNIWRVPKENRFCINYKYGSNIIPAGTEVSKVKVKSNGCPKSVLDCISFKIVKEGKTITIGYRRNYHPGKRIEDYKKMMFTTKTLSELTKGMTANEIRAIKAGVLVQGMSKRAVLAAYGPPPEHYTPNLNSNRWLYWAFLTTTKTVFFNKDDILIGGADVIFDNCDIKGKLIRLHDLLENGLITQEQHDKKKRRFVKKVLTV